MGGDFLSARTQKLVINGTKSTPLPVSSGVPQGTVLGPLLFLAYINDIPEGIRSTVKLFTDDSLVYRKIGKKRDCEELQQYLDRLQEWKKKCFMAFNAVKCEVLCITNKKKQIQHNYFIHGQQLATKSDLKYLVDTISSNLSWSKHVNNISRKRKLHHGLLETQHQTSFPTSKEYCLQDLCTTDSRVRLKGLASTHRHQLKPARDCTEKKSCQICQE